jgi:hypothetical protein
MKTPHSLAAYLGSALLCLALGAGNASAATLTVAGYTLGETVGVSSAGRSGTVNTAELKLGLSGVGSGFGYCVDLAQSITTGISTGWEVRSPFSSDQIIRASWLVDNFQPAFDSMIHPAGDSFAFSVSKQTAIAALQVSIWEVMGESGTSYDLYSGAFSVTNASDGVMNLSRQFLGALSGADLSGYQTNAVWAVSATQQDQLFFGRVNPIPETRTFALYALGAALVAFAMRRRIA